MKKALTGLYHSFYHAYMGLVHVWLTQRNMRVHFAAGYLVLVLASWLKYDALRTLILFLTVGAVIVAELFNTAVEATIDVATGEYHVMAKVAKDVAAAAVLVTSLLSLVVAVYLFGPDLPRLATALSIEWAASPGSVMLHAAVFIFLFSSAFFV